MKRKLFTCLLAIILCLEGFSLIVVADNQNTVTNGYEYHSTLYYDADNPYRVVTGNSAYAYECYISNKNDAGDSPFPLMVFVHNNKIVRNAGINKHLRIMYFAQSGKDNPLFLNEIKLAQDFIRVAQGLMLNDVVEDISSIAAQSLGKIGATYLIGGSVSISAITEIVTQQSKKTLGEHFKDVAQILSDAQVTYFYLTAIHMETTISKLDSIRDFSSFKNCEIYFNNADILMRSVDCAKTLTQAITKDLENSDEFSEVLLSLALDVGKGFVGDFSVYIDSYNTFLQAQQADPDHFAKIIKVASLFSEGAKTLDKFEDAYAIAIDFGLGDLFTITNAKTAYNQAITIDLLLASSNKVGLLEHPFDEIDTSAISSPNDLNKIRNNPSGTYHLTNDIVFSEDDFKAGGQFYNNGAFWIPIETFTGVLDGNGYSIVGLKINSPQKKYPNRNDTGLFAKTNGATIKSLTMKGGSTYAQHKTGTAGYAGGFVGYSENTTFIDCHNYNTVKGTEAGGITAFAQSSTFQNCTNHGNIAFLEQDHNDYYGGIVGRTGGNIEITGCGNFGNIDGKTCGGIVGGDHASSSTITYCFNSGTVKSSNTIALNAGGIVGNASSKLIQYCYNNGSITGHNAGGIIGSSYASPTIRDCYNRGTITARNNSSYGGSMHGGGISGQNGNIKYCYSVGTVIGSPASAGNVAAIACSDQVTNSYARSDLTYNYPDGSIRYTLQEMKDQSIYQNFDFSNTWAIAADSNDGFPYLNKVFTELPSYTIYDRKFEKNIDYYTAALDSSSYDTTFSNMLCALSVAVYFEEEVTQAYQSLGFTEGFDTINYSIFDDDSSSCAYAIGFKDSEYRDGKVCLITIRGTHSAGDLIQDFDIRTTEQNHLGFYQPALLIRNQIMEYLLDNGILANDVKYVITGHSRGAAIANLLSVRLMEESIPAANVYNYNYACPDVACKDEFPTYTNIFNLCNTEDLIAFVPGVLCDPFVIGDASWDKFGFTYWFTEDVGNFLDNHNINQYLSFFDSQLTFSDWPFSPLSYSEIWIAKIFCPVDVTISDKDGNPIASVINGQTNYFNPDNYEVFIFTDGDKKVVYMGENADYYIDLVGTDTGAMTFSIEQHNFSSGEVVAAKTFSNVALEEGKTMYSPVGDSSTVSDVALLVVKNQDGEKTPTHTIDTQGKETALICTHVWDEGVIKKQPTHTEFGEIVYACIECKETQSKAIEKTAEHTYGDWIVTKEASETEPGSKEKACACGHVITEEIPQIPANTETSEATTEQDTTTYESSEQTQVSTEAPQTETEASIETETPSETAQETGTDSQTKAQEEEIDGLSKGIVMGIGLSAVAVLFAIGCYFIFKKRSI